jgi:hypothetical protein
MRRRAVYKFRRPRAAVVALCELAAFAAAAVLAAAVLFAVFVRPRG